LKANDILEIHKHLTKSENEAEQFVRRVYGETKDAQKWKMSIMPGLARSYRDDVLFR